MKMQEAAKQILEEAQKPLSSKEIAKRALERKMVTSNAKDPIFSLYTTIEKNIRDGIYNDPKLVKIHTPGEGHLIGLPSWEGRIPVGTQRVPERKDITVTVPLELLNKIELAAHAQLADSFNGTMILIIEAGLAAVSETIKERIMEQLLTLKRSR
jgi:hypothetical protein